MNSTYRKVFILIAIGILLPFTLPVVMPILFVFFYKQFKKGHILEEKRKTLYNEVSLNPSNEAVDKLKYFIEQNGCIDTPKNWNQLRAVWVSINESPNVRTEKKKEIIQFLRLKGLTMYYKEAEVIDNYGK